MKLMNSFAGRVLLLGVFAFSILVGGTFASAKEERKVSHILLPSKARAETVRKEVIDAGGDGKAFTAACYKHSMDATTKPLGGNLGFISQSSGYDPAFSAAAFNLKEGGISEPVLTEFGWHLIHVSAIKGAAAQKQAGATPAKGQKSPTPQTPAKPPVVTPAKPPVVTPANPPVVTPAKPPVVTPAKPPVVTPAKPPVVTPAPRPVQPSTPAAAKAAQAASDAKAAALGALPRRRPLGAGSNQVVLTIESLNSSSRTTGSQLIFGKSDAVELDLTLKNKGKSEVRLPAPVLLPLGFVVTRLSDNKTMAGDFSGVAEPASFFITLKSWEITGMAISLNEYFPSLTPTGRYSINWSSQAFAANLEARFAKAKELPDYPGLKAALLSDKLLRTRKIFLDRSRRRPSPISNDFEFSSFGLVVPNAKYYARIDLTTGGDPVVFELSARKPRNVTAVGHFINLANEGFYDNLNFYDVQAGNYALGGCSSRNGMGVPPSRLNQSFNEEGVKHTAGTVSFVTRTSSRKGKTKGGEVGSIFFVSLKDHPEWDTEHVPIGKVVKGLDVFEKLTDQASFRRVVILTEAEYNGQSPDDIVVAPVVTTPPPSTPTPPKPPVSDVGNTNENPEILIKTARGDLSATLFENNCYSTVASFVTLAEKDFFSKGPDGGKMTFYEALEEDGKNLCLITGSPTNDGDGDPGYQLIDEETKHKCERGSLVMLKQYDEETGGYAANSSGSQFFICVQDIRAFDVNHNFTVFGKITKGLEVLDKLKKGDALEAIKIVKKKSHTYGNIRKVK